MNFSTIPSRNHIEFEPMLFISSKRLSFCSSVRFQVMVLIYHIYWTCQVPHWKILAFWTLKKHQKPVLKPLPHIGEDFRLSEHHHLSDSITRTVTDFFDAMHLRIICDNFSKSLVMMEVLVVGENSWEWIDFLRTDSSSFTVITQTISTCRNFAIHVQGLSALALIFSLNMKLQLFGDYLEVL